MNHPPLRLVAAALVLVSTLAGCGGESGTSPSASGSASSKVRGGLTPNSMKTANVPKSGESAAPTATTLVAPPELSKGGCPETEKGKRACTAAEFQKAWQAAKEPSTHPSNATYKISGKVKKVETTDKSKGETGDTRVYFAGDSKDVGFLFLAGSKDLEAASKLAVGADATFNCKFGGLEEIGVVTLTDCTL